MLAQGIAPFAEPPVGFLALARRRVLGRRVVIAGDVVDLLAPVTREHRVLAHHLLPLLVLGLVPEPRVVAEVQRNIPRDRRATERAAVFRLAQRLGQRFEIHGRRLETHEAVQDPGARGLVGADMLVADHPKIEGFRLHLGCGGLLRGGGEQRSRKRRRACLDQISALR